MVVAMTVLLLQVAVATAPPRAVPLGDQPTLSRAAAAINFQPGTPAVSAGETVVASAPAGEPTLGGIKTGSEGTAANTQVLNGVRVIEPLPPPQPFKARPQPSYRLTPAWVALAVAQHSAAAFDAWSTRRALERGRCEANPLLRPFANSDGLYAAIQTGPVLFDYLGRRMQRSANPFLRRIWWLPQGLSIAGSLSAGSYNLAHTR